MAKRFSPGGSRFSPKKKDTEEKAAGPAGPRVNVSVKLGGKKAKAQKASAVLGRRAAKAGKADAKLPKGGGRSSGGGKAGPRRPSSPKKK